MVNATQNFWISIKTLNEIMDVKNACSDKWVKTLPSQGGKRLTNLESLSNKLNSSRSVKALKCSIEDLYDLIQDSIEIVECTGTSLKSDDDIHPYDQSLFVEPTDQIYNSEEDKLEDELAWKIANEKFEDPANPVKKRLVVKTVPTKNQIIESEGRKLTFEKINVGNRLSGTIIKVEETYILVDLGIRECAMLIPASNIESGDTFNYIVGNKLCATVVKVTSRFNYDLGKSQPKIVGSLLDDAVNKYRQAQNDYYLNKDKEALFKDKFKLPVPEKEVKVVKEVTESKAEDKEVSKSSQFNEVIDYLDFVTKRQDCGNLNPFEMEFNGKKFAIEINFRKL